MSAPPPNLTLEKRGKLWCVVTRAGAILYSSTFYAKAVGAFELLESAETDPECSHYTWQPRT